MDPLGVSANGEFTLEDAYGILDDGRKELERRIEALIDVELNNEPKTLGEMDTVVEIAKKQHRLAQNLSHQVRNETRADYPIPKTLDLYASVIGEMEDEIDNMQELLSRMQSELKGARDEVIFSKNKADGLKSAKRMCLEAIENVEGKTYTREVAITSHLFRRVKMDLRRVVDELFPDNDQFQDLMVKLTSAYTKGGDDIYVDVSMESLCCINFLLEADLIMYHPNDKSKIRLVDLL